MEIAKKELEAVKEVTANVDELGAQELMDLQLALVGGGTTDVTFC